MSRPVDCPCFAPDSSGVKCVGGIEGCWECEHWNQDPRAYLSDDDMRELRLKRTAEFLKWTPKIDRLSHCCVLTLRKLFQGEDEDEVAFSVAYKTPQELVKDVADYVRAFSVDQHIIDRLSLQMYRYKKPPSFRDLLMTAENIREDLDLLLWAFNKMLDESWFQTVNHETLMRVIADREPHGKYIGLENGKYIAIDNSHGDAWTEEFDDEADCLLWLAGFTEVTS